MVGFCFYSEVCWVFYFGVYFKMCMKCGEWVWLYLYKVGEIRYVLNW